MVIAREIRERHEQKKTLDSLYLWHFPRVSRAHKMLENLPYKGLSSAAAEDLAWRESSDGKRLDAGRVRVQARRSGDLVDALIAPH
jgi:hypothetical protein